MLEAYVEDSFEAEGLDDHIAVLKICFHLPSYRHITRVKSLYNQTGDIEDLLREEREYMLKGLYRT